MTSIRIPAPGTRTCPTCGAPNRPIVVLFGYQLCDLCLASIRHYLGLRAKAGVNRVREVVPR